MRRRHKRRAALPAVFRKASKRLSGAITLPPQKNSAQPPIAAMRQIGEGMTIELDSGSRLNYWFAGNGQCAQYSGSAAYRA